MSLAYLNGEYQDLAETQISVLDRGFLFGDGVYEVIPVYQGKHLFRASKHLQRLDKSLAAIKIAPPLSHDEWFTIFEKLLDDNNSSEHTSIYLQITRGADTQRNHLFPAESVTPTVFAYVNPVQIRSKAELSDGLKVLTHDDIRWSACYIKAITLLPNLLLMQQASKQNRAETLLFRNNDLTEACSSNVFVVRNGEVLTPKKTEFILGGITRNFILEILHEQSIPYRETSINRHQLIKSDEVWITSSTKEISPVVQIDEYTIGDGKPGPLWSKVYDLYQIHLRQEFDL